MSRERTAPVKARELLTSLDHRLPAQRLEDARLLLSELVTNAVKYGGDGDLELKLRRSKGRFRAEVIDTGTGFDARARERNARARGRDLDLAGGWGLHLVERLADRWGSFAGSTHVWFELDV